MSNPVPNSRPVRLYEVLYVSTLAESAPISVVGAIAGVARAANDKLGITGLLIFDGMRFCQQLEGNQKEVLALIERISNDTRHDNVLVLHAAPLAERRFRNFSLAYAPVEDVDVLARLETLDGEAAVAEFTALLKTIDLEG